MLWGPFAVPRILNPLTGVPDGRMTRTLANPAAVKMPIIAVNKLPATLISLMCACPGANKQGDVLVIDLTASP